MDKAKEVMKPEEIQDQTQKPIPNTSPNGVILKENSTSISPQNENGFIRKKWAYIKFKRAIKKGNYVSAKLTAKALGIDVRTIHDWSSRREIQQLLNDNIDLYVKKIQKSKDWKASAYLLDKIEDTDATTNIQLNVLEGLTIIRK